MKKIISIIGAIFLVIIIQKSADASYTSVLSYALKNDAGLFFSCTADFEEGNKLITVSDNEDGFIIRVYSEDGETAKDDEIMVPAGKGNSLYVVRDGYIKLMLCIDKRYTLYTMRESRFIPEPVKGNEEILRPIIEYSAIGANHFGNKAENIYYLINSLKEKNIEELKVRDIQGYIADAELGMIRRTITAAADMMSFDCRNFDDLKAMKYILNTSRNFEIIVPVKPVISINKNDNVNLVSQSYADYIAKNIFGFTPQKPYINELTSKGYCVNGKYYCYTPAFNVYFSTEIKDIRGIYEVGRNMYYVIFRDIYTEGNKVIPEYSYAVLKREDMWFKVLKLEMGGEPIDKFSDFSLAN